jgi:hypothetical protein
LKLDRRGIEDLALQDKSGAGEFPPPKGRRPCVVITDRGAAPAERPLDALT